MSVVLVTGGSRGLGRAIVEALAERGDRVAFTFRSEERQAREVEERTGGAARAFRFDLQDREAPAALMETVGSALGPLDGLVNNAGVRQDAILALTPDAQWDAILDINLGGTFRCCRAALRSMLPRRSGSIVNLSSLTALHGVAGQTAYGASKAAILGLTRSLAREVGPRGIRVNAVVPGFVPTDLTAALPGAAVDKLRASESLRAGVSPASVAASVAFLLSPEAASITGQTLVVDAGASS